MTREEALQLVKQNIKNQNLVKHMLATESIMKALARKFGENEKIWGLCGLLHDIDYEKTEGQPERHGLVAYEMLGDQVETTVIQAIKSHNEKTGIKPETLLDKALYAVDPLTGLIVAATLVLPDKKLASLTLESVLNRFKEKRFAAGASREQIKTCGNFGLNLEEFVKIGLEAMQNISKELGL